MMRYSAVLKFVATQYAGHAARTHFRQTFLESELCRRIEGYRLSYFTVFHFGQPQVTVKVNDDEFIWLKMLIPADSNIVIEKREI